MRTTILSAIWTPTGRAGILAAVVVLGAVLSFPTLQAQQAPAFTIIVNAENPAISLTRKEISDLFVKKVHKWQHGHRAQPVDLPISSDVRAHFSRRIHRKSVIAIKGYFAKSLFSGSPTLPPRVMKSEADVVAYVVANPGGIGYVSTQAGIGGAKAISVEDLSEVPTD